MHVLLCVLLCVLISPGEIVSGDLQLFHGQVTNPIIQQVQLIINKHDHSNFDQARRVNSSRLSSYSQVSK